MKRKPRKKIILLIGAGRFQIPAILKAKEMGLTVVATDKDPDAPGFKFADFHEIANVKDFKATCSVARRYKVNGVLSIVSELGVLTSARVAEALKLPGLTPAVARAATNKGLMRQIFKKHNLPSPKFMVVKTKHKALEAANTLSLPIVIKPVDNSGSRGVLKVEKIKEVGRAFAQAKKFSRNGKVILETFVNGEEVTVEALSFNGKHEILAISNKKHISFPHCVSVDLTYPPPYKEDLLNDIRSLITKTLTALGINSGASHSEVLITSEGPFLVEVAARGGGFGIFSDVIPLVSGVDIVKECIYIAMGSRAHIKSKQHKAAVLRFFVLPEGKIQTILGLEDAKNLPGVRTIELEVKEGDRVKPITSDGTRPGFVITFGERRQEAIEVADKVERTLKFRIV